MHVHFIIFRVMSQWHIYVFLTFSCIRTLVAPTNLSIITSIGTEINNDPLKFKDQICHVNHEI